jgi:hypothetical protein
LRPNSWPARTQLLAQRPRAGAAWPPSAVDAGAAEVAQALLDGSQRVGRVGPGEVEAASAS